MFGKGQFHLKPVETGFFAINEYNAVLFEINELCFFNKHIQLTQNDQAI